MTRAPTPGPGREEGLLALLLRAYPQGFRTRFGAGMAHGLRADLERARRRGRAATIGFWARSLLHAAAFGTLERVRGVFRPSRSPAGRAGDLPAEVGRAARALLRRPGFTASAVGTLGIGIGATTAIFAVAYAVLLKPLPYPDASTLVTVGHRSPTDELGIPAAGYLHYRERARSLAALAIYLESSSAVSGAGEPLELGFVQATPSLFAVLGVETHLGRLLDASDAEPDADAVAVVSHGYWTRRLGADPEAIGRPVVTDSRTVVVGVLPADFSFARPPATIVFGRRLEEPDVYLPLRLDPARVGGFGNFMYQGLARLSPGSDAASAARELDALMREAAAERPGGFTAAELDDGSYHARVQPIAQAIAGDAARVLWLLLGAVGFVLLVASVNVANLFLVRAEARRGETAVRWALGAGTRGLARAFLAESLLIAGGAAALGLVVAGLGTGALLRLAPPGLPRLDEVGLHGPVVALALLVAALAGAGLGLAPLAGRSERASAGALADESRTRTGSGRSRARDGLAALQVALAVVLLVGSALLVRTSRNLASVDPGFDPSRTLTLRLSLSSSILASAGYDLGRGDLSRSRLMLDLAEQLERLPGVERAAFTGDLPLNGDEWHDFVAVEEAFGRSLDPGIKALRVFVGPGYVDAIGGRLLRGRELESLDFADQPRQVLVNEAFARQRWGDDDPLGRRLTQFAPGVDPSQDIWYTVVGVVADVRETSLMLPAEPTVYLPTVFLPEGGFGMFVNDFIAVVRTQGPPLEALPAVRATIREAVPEVPIYEVATLDEVVRRSFQDVAFATTLLLIAALCSVGLGMVGCYGTVAYVVGLRRREFGLRLALGASKRTVRWGVLRQGAGIATAGVATGLLGAWACSAFLESMLFGVGGTDPWVYGAVSAALFAITMFASWVPAVRAAAADPSAALRSE